MYSRIGKDLPSPAELDAFFRPLARAKDFREGERRDIMAAYLVEAAKGIVGVLDDTKSRDEIDPVVARAMAHYFRERLSFSELVPEDDPCQTLDDLVKYMVRPPIQAVHKYVSAEVLLIGAEINRDGGRWGVRTSYFEDIIRLGRRNRCYSGIVLKSPTRGAAFLLAPAAWLKNRLGPTIRRAGSRVSKRRITIDEKKCAAAFAGNEETCMVFSVAESDWTIWWLSRLDERLNHQGAVLLTEGVIL